MVASSFGIVKKIHLFQLLAKRCWGFPFVIIIGHASSTLLFCQDYLKSLFVDPIYAVLSLMVCRIVCQICGLSIYACKQHEEVNNVGVVG